MIPLPRPMDSVRLASGTRAIGRVSIEFSNLQDDPGDGAVHVNDGSLAIEDEFANAGSVFVNSAAEMLFDPGDGPLRAGLCSNSNIVVVEDGAQMTITGAAAPAKGA